MNQNRTDTPEVVGVSSRNTDDQGTQLALSDEQENQTRFDGLNADELAHMPYLEPDADLEPGETYLDLNDLDRGPFKASANQVAAHGNRLVAKLDVKDAVWTQLAE